MHKDDINILFEYFTDFSLDILKISDVLYFRNIILYIDLFSYTISKKIHR